MEGGTVMIKTARSIMEVTTMVLVVVIPSLVTIFSYELLYWMREVLQ